MSISRRNMLFVLFTLSGFSGLIYESIWSHYLKLFLGHAAYAQALVLAIFMGGLTIGSWLCSRYSAGWKNLLMGYAVAEGVVGLFALFFHPVFDMVMQYSYAMIMPGLHTPTMVNMFKWTLSSFLILPQTILLGMTFPLMSTAIVRAFPHNSGKSIAMLYFTNSIGAAFGVLVSGFLLIRLVGLPGTISFAGFINIALAAIVWLLARDAETRTIGRPIAVSVREFPDKKPWYRYLLVASLVTGTASFIYEIGWIRMLSLVLGGSTHAFELMLSAFIFGLAFGGLWIQSRIDRTVDPVRFLVIVQIIMGVLAMATLPLYENMFEVMRWILSILKKTDAGYTLFNLSSNAIALAVMLPATFCAGMTLPLITYALIKQGHGERSIGAVYAMNTVGAIIGVFFAIHVGMPVFGLKGLIIFGAGLDMTLGLFLLWRSMNRELGYRVLSTMAMVCLCAVFAALLFVKLDPYKMASGVYRSGYLLSPERSKLIFHEDGKTATVSVEVEDERLMRIRTNGKVDAGVVVKQDSRPSIDESTMVIAAALGMAFNPTAKSAANIGLGSGLTTNTLLNNPLLEVVDTIEIEKEMVEAAKNFGDRVALVYDDPRSNIYIDDAKTHFASYNKKYDIIISEPSNPWVSGVAGLFSEEFYRLIGRHLNDGGVFVQWVQMYEIDVNLLSSVLKALSPNFSDYAVYGPNFGDLLIVAKKQGMVVGSDGSIFKAPGIASALDRLNIKNIQDIEVRRIGNKKSMDALFASFPAGANSDYFPILDQNAARTRFLGISAQDIFRLSLEPLPALEMLSGIGYPAHETNVSLSPFYPKTQLTSRAMQLRDYYLHDRFDPRYGAIERSAKERAINFRRIFYACGDEPEPSRLAVIFDTATSIFPYLNPSESERIWGVLESGPCTRVFSRVERTYVSLFKSVGKRDAGAMAKAAKEILETQRNIDPVHLRYVVAAGMLGNVVLGNRGEAARLWSSHRSELERIGYSGLLFRLLVAESYSI